MRTTSVLGPLPRRCHEQVRTPERGCALLGPSRPVIGQAGEPADANAFKRSLVADAQRPGASLRAASSIVINGHWQLLNGAELRLSSSNYV
jgi:hypothetical protein